MQNAMRHLAYGSVECGLSAIESFIRLYLLVYYTDVVGISPALAGQAIALGVLWDACLDPFIGRSSDATRTRFGRRAPWIFVATPLLCAATVMLFHQPASVSELMAVFWLFTANILVNSTLSAVAIPHLAFGADITSNQGERTAMYAWRMGMSVCGLFLGLAIPAVLTSQGYVKQNLYSASAYGLCMLVVALSVMFFIFFRREFSAQQVDWHQSQATSSKAEKSKILHFLRQAPVAATLAGYAIATFGQGMNSSLAMFYYQYFLNLAPSQLQVVLLLFMITLVASLPLWVWLSRKFRKDSLLSVGVLILGIITIVSYPLLPKGLVWPAVAVGIAGGLALGCIALFESHLTDLAAWHGGGETFMGSVFGVWKFIAKASRALAIACSGQILSWIGYRQPVAAGASAADSAITIDAQVAWHIALAFGPLVGLFFVVGGIILRFGNPRGSSKEQQQ